MYVKEPVNELSIWVSKTAISHEQAMDRITRCPAEDIGLAQVERGDERKFASCFAAPFFNTDGNRRVVLHICNIGSGVLVPSQFNKYQQGEQVQCWLGGHRYMINSY